MLSDPKYNPLRRFDSLAAIYAKYRPDYPERALDWIVERVAHRTLPIADIGAGTGILSRALAKRSLNVVGIEPNDAMREQAVREGGASIDYRPGRAEQTGLSDQSVSGVVVAQAFHWCDPAAALDEFHRILVPDGWATLIWNDADNDDPFTNGYWSALRSGTPEPEMVEKPHHVAGEPILTHPLFEVAIVRTIGHLQVVDEEGLLGRAFSVSFAPKECSAADRFSRRLRELHQRFAEDGVARLRYRTTLYQARRR